MRRVLVTRAAGDVGPLLSQLAEAGMHGVAVPLIERVVSPAAILEAAAGDPDCWMLTSPFVVTALVHAGCTPGRARVAVVGPATAKAAEDAGWTVTIQPSVATARSLVDALGELADLRVFYPRADLADDATLDVLRVGGALVDDVVAYRNVLPAGAAQQLHAAWPVDGVALLSGSAARRLVQILPPPWPPSTMVVAIGPSTAAVLAELGVSCAAVAEPHSVAGVVAALRRLWHISAPGDTVGDPIRRD